MKVELRRDLNMVAARLAAPTVQRLADAVAEEARRRAPNAKVWLSRDDGRVRPAHVHAHGQTIPDNLRYRLRKQTSGGNLAPGYDLARLPRDRNLPADQRMRCRCLSVTLLGLIARRIVVSPPVVTATAARAQVSVRFHRIVESEFGTGQDKAARFLSGAVDEVALRLAARARRL